MWSCNICAPMCCRTRPIASTSSSARLFNHLLHLPLSYFETRAAGQTVARVRELETIRAFLTGQGLSSLIDLIFTVVFIAVLFAYSWFLALIVPCSAPPYSII